MIKRVAISPSNGGNRIPDVFKEKVFKDGRRG